MTLEVLGSVIPCSAPSTFKTLKSMSKNQRSRKGTQNLREEILRDKNEELIRLVKSLVVKIDKQDMMSCVLNFNNSSPKLLTCWVRFTTYSKGLILLMTKLRC